MSKNKDYLKVLSTLSLAASDAREDTLTSIILNTLYERGALNKLEICTEIEKIYGFAPYTDEIFYLLRKLSEKNSIEDKDDKFHLNSEQKKRLDDLDIILRDQEKARFQNFKNFITEELKAKIDLSRIKLLWEVFKEFLYSNFYEYGEDALYRFHPHLEGENKSLKDEDFYQIAFLRLKEKELNPIFRTIVEKFPDYASKEDINFLNDLAQKTLSFASLGSNPDLVESALDKNLLDWVLYLDTNVIYSLLGLHSHPENESSEALIKLIKDNSQQINIILRYSELTKKELNSKRDEFNLLDEKLPDSSIRAMLQTDNLDDFSKQFYEQLLQDRNSTIHPSQVIDLSTDLLKKREIDISRNQKRVEELGEDYLNIKVQEYRRFIDTKNDIRQEFCREKKIPFRPIYRSDKQIIHDITLREIIISQRGSSLKKKNIEPSFNTVKYFAVTLDQVLMDFDKSQLKNYDDEQSFPIFFRPSFLLNKLVKILPIKTSDYKKAFLKAVSSRGFNKDIKKSRDILKIVNFLKSKGIDNEDVIYNMISEELFLEKFKENQKDPEFNQEIFIESELNREFKEREKELKRTKNILSKKENEVEIQSKKSKGLEEKKLSLEEELQQYKIALTQLNKDVKNLKKRPIENSTQAALNFEAEEEKAKKEEYKQELIYQIENEIKIFKTNEFKRWQRKSLYSLLILIPLTLFCLSIILFPSLIPDSTIDPTTIRLILGFLTFLIDGLLVKIIYARYWDENNMEKKRIRIEAPHTLKSKLDKLTKK